MKKGAFVYRFFTECGELLYVGCTQDFRVRLREHKRQAQWFLEVGNYVVRRYRRRSDALSAESWAIFREKPKYNVNYQSSWGDRMKAKEKIGAK